LFVVFLGRSFVFCVFGSWDSCVDSPGQPSACSSISVTPLVSPLYFTRPPWLSSEFIGS
jgi:hypothetical protein